MLALGFDVPDALAGSVWTAVRDGDDVARALFDGHYSRSHYRDNRHPRLFVGPGEKTVLLTADLSALFVWRRFHDASGQQGVNCAVFRRLPTCSIQASALILDAERWAARRWPGQRLYTYVDAHKVQSPNPGYCFKQAGWQFCGITQRHQLHILAKLP